MATTLANISIKDSSSWNTYLNLIYPVGSIYIAYTSTSPASRFGGTWSQITSKFLYCTTNVNTGGSNTHTLTIDEMPAHSHQWYGWNWFETIINSGDKALMVGSDLAGPTASTGGGKLTTTCPHTKEFIAGGELLRKVGVA